MFLQVFLVVRSTLVIHDTKLSDQGVYQCRASASPAKHDDGINVYQHWKIEEAPVKDLQCGGGEFNVKILLSREVL